MPKYAINDLVAKIKPAENKEQIMKNIQRG